MGFFSMEEEMDYKVLRKIQQMEKNSPILSDVAKNFYLNLSDFLLNLNKRLEKESSNQKQTILKEEIENIKKIAINIYEHREKKITLAAISKARGGKPDLKNMVDEEKKLYNSVLDIMKKSREKILNQKTEEIKEEINEKSEEEKPEEEKPEEENNYEEYIENPNPIIKINENINEFVGTDKKRYNLRANDILSIPEDMSKILIKKGVAEKVNQ